MTQLICRISLIIYGFCAVFFINADASFIMAFLLSFSLSCSSFYFRSKKYSFIICGIYLIIGMIYPSLFLFLPVIVYEITIYHNLYLYLIAAAGFWRICYIQPSPLPFLVAAGCLFSLLLAYQAAAYDVLTRNYQKSRDDSTELNILLQDRNKTLLEKQNYEIYTATLKERNRIAREIHDNVGHMLSRSILMVGAIRTVQKEASLDTPLLQLEHTLNDAMDSIRKSVHDLHDESVNLKEAVEGLITSFDFCRISFTYDMSLQVPREIKYSFISITKEALSNIIKHSNASAAQITIREHPGLFQLIIEDNGTKKSPNRESGIGLINMQDRIKALNGTIQIQSDKGFRIFITIPKTNTEMKERQ